MLTHTFAVVDNVRREMPGDFRITRLAALFHDIGKPRTRKVLPGKGMTFYHHEVVGARMTKERLRTLRYSNDDVERITQLVFLSGRFHTYQMGWTDSAVRRYVRDAGNDRSRGLVANGSTSSCTNAAFAQSRVNSDDASGVRNGSGLTALGLGTSRYDSKSSSWK